MLKTACSKKHEFFKIAVCVCVLSRVHWFGLLATYFFISWLIYIYFAEYCWRVTRLWVFMWMNWRGLRPGSFQFQAWFMFIFLGRKISVLWNSFPFISIRLVLCIYEWGGICLSWFSSFCAQIVYFSRYVLFFFTLRLWLGENAMQVVKTSVASAVAAALSGIEKKKQQQQTCVERWCIERKWVWETHTHHHKQ